MKAYLVFDSQLISGKFSFFDIVAELSRVGAHEIEIPAGATMFQYQTTNGSLYAFYRDDNIRSYGHFPIPRPKRKVKKWKYAFVVANEIVCQTQHLSEDEVARMTCYGPKRIDETMIEVEE